MSTRESRPPWGVLLICAFMLGSLGLRALGVPAPVARAPAPPTPPALAAEVPSDPALRALLDAQPMRINHASRAALESLPGIGPGLSERIDLARRQSPFRSLDDLRKVRGLGRKKVARLAPFVRFD